MDIDIREVAQKSSEEVTSYKLSKFIPSII